MEATGLVCIVTGASSGIGAATARQLAARGNHVVLAARRIERLDALAGELGDALAVATDVTNALQVAQLIERSLEAFGRIDVLVNNAGQGLHVPVARIEPDDLRAVFELNVVAPLSLLQAVLPAMSAQSSGAIVNVSSATSLRVFAGVGGYSATKAALNMLSQVARVELEGSGVTVSVVYPSVTATEFHDHLRAGEILGGARGIVPDPPDLVATAILFAIESGEGHVLVASPPQAFAPGDSPWGALLARPLSTGRPPTT